MEFFFLLALFRALTDVPHLRVRSWNPKLCLLGFERCHFWPSVKLLHVCFLTRILPNWSISVLEILANDIFLSFGAFSSAYRCATHAFSVLES